MSQRWFRHLRVLLSLIYISGFLLLFSDVKALLKPELFSTFTFLQFIPSLLMATTGFTLLATGFILVILLTFLAGRVYCSAICPLGILQDAIAFLQRKIKRKKANYRFKKPLNLWRYSILILVFVALFFTEILSLNLLDPYANFGRISSQFYQPVFIFFNNIFSKLLMSFDIYAIQPLPQKVFFLSSFLLAFSVFVLIVFMVLKAGRLYCNTVCPVGTVLGMLSRISVFKFRINTNSCTHCGKCQTVCKAQCINVKEMTIDESRCVSCFNCISACNYSSIALAAKTKVPKIEVSDSSKRNFLRTGIMLLGLYPIILKAQEEHEEGKHKYRENGDKHDEKENHRGGSNPFRTKGPVTPPGSENNSHFIGHCVACHLCISSCPSKVLQPSFLEYGFTGMNAPMMHYSSGYCNYECTMCGDVCPTGAIQPLQVEVKKLTQIGKVRFEKRHCIVESEGTACGSCSEHCPTQAVKMVAYKGDLTIPETDGEICIGCGACEYACPVTDPHPAIFVIPNTVHQLAKKPKGEKIEVIETEEFPF